jgi:hypothetical protein
MLDADDVAVLDLAGDALNASAHARNVHRRGILGERFPVHVHAPEAHRQTDDDSFFPPASHFQSKPGALLRPDVKVILGEMLTQMLVSRINTRQELFPLLSEMRPNWWRSFP